MVCNLYVNEPVKKKILIEGILLQTCPVLLQTVKVMKNKTILGTITAITTI